MITPEDLYDKEYGNADSVSKESVIRLLRHFATVLHNERAMATQLRGFLDFCEDHSSLEVYRGVQLLATSYLKSFDDTENR